MKILFLTNHKYLPELFAGMEINTDLLCQEIMKSNDNIEVAVACGLYGGKNLLGISSKIKRYLNSTDVTTDIYNSYKCYRAFELYKHIDKVISEFNPDAIVVQGGDKYYEILNSLCDYSIPVISYLHTSDSLEMKSSFNLPDNITYIANSEYTRKNHKDKTISFIMPPLIISEKYEVKTERKFITLVNPIPHKGLEKVALLAKNNPKLKFLFVLAHKSDIVDLNKYLNKVGGINNVTIEGPFKNMKDVYKKTKLILMPSKQESWGRVATEAHCSGIPVLASDVEGLPESVGKGGINLPIGSDLSVWQDALNYMLTDDVYAEFVKQTIKFSKRDEINPSFLVNRFIQHIYNQINRVKK